MSPELDAELLSLAKTLNGLLVPANIGSEVIRQKELRDTISRAAEIVKEAGKSTSRNAFWLNILTAIVALAALVTAIWK